jgi:hypothetical protein
MSSIIDLNTLGRFVEDFRFLSRREHQLRNEVQDYYCIIVLYHLYLHGLGQWPPAVVTESHSCSRQCTYHICVEDNQ